MKRIAIRADGSSNIGMGHIMRCMAIAKEFKKRNIEVLFITKQNEIVSNILVENKLKIINITPMNLKEEILIVKNILLKENIDTILVDSYYLSDNYLNQLSVACKLLISIDDNNLYTNPSDIIINPNIYGPDLNYYVKNSKVKLLLGWDYIILRDEFINLSPIIINEKVKNILVTMGGTDINNYTIKVLKSINNIEATINVIIGSGFKCIDEIKRISEDKTNINLIYNPSNIAQVMKENDIAISAGGTTIYELASLGIPTILITQAENQKNLAEKVDKLKLMNYLGCFKEVKEEYIEKNVVQLMKDKQSREYMSNECKNIINRNGVANIINEILLYNAKLISN